MLNDAILDIRAVVHVEKWHHLRHIFFALNRIKGLEDAMMWCEMKRLCSTKLLLKSEFISSWAFAPIATQLRKVPHVKPANRSIERPG